MELISAKPFHFVSTVTSKTAQTAQGLQWPKQDLIKYGVFMAFHLNMQQTTDEQDCVSWSFFRKLSIFVQSKNPNQCRIHHKRMMADHGSINSLVSHFRASIQKFQEWYNYYESVLFNLRSCLLREKEDSQKQHTIQPNKISNQINSKQLELQADASLKKNEDLQPTNDKYAEEAPAIHPPTRPQRPSFNALDLEQSGAFDQNLSFFDGDLSRRAEVSKKGVLGSSQEMWKDCQLSFKSYMGKLNVLMNSSLYDY